MSSMRTKIISPWGNISTTWPHFSIVQLFGALGNLFSEGWGPFKDPRVFIGGSELNIFTLYTFIA